MPALSLYMVNQGLRLAYPHIAKLSAKIVYTDRAFAYEYEVYLCVCVCVQGLLTLKSFGFCPVRPIWWVEHDVICSEGAGIPPTNLQHCK